MRQSRAPPARAAVRSVAYGQLLGGAVSGPRPGARPRRSMPTGKRLACGAADAGAGERGRLQLPLI